MENPFGYNQGDRIKITREMLDGYVALRKRKFTILEICEEIGISYRTFRKHIEKFEDYEKRKCQSHKSSRGRGRPRGTGLLNDELADKIVSLARCGLTEEKLAELSGIARTTIWKWKRDNDDFKKRIDNAKLEADMNVVNALYKRCIGYDFEETDIKEILSPNDENRVLYRERKRKKKQIAPNIDGQRLWLSNRLGWSTSNDAPVGNEDDSRTEYDVRESLYKENTEDSEEK